MRLIGKDAKILAVGCISDISAAIDNATITDNILAIFKDVELNYDRTSETTKATMDNMTHRRPILLDWTMSISVCAYSDSAFASIAEGYEYMCVLVDWGDADVANIPYVGLIKKVTKTMNGPGEQVRKIELESFGYEDVNQ